jgi:hypothetical protein
MEQGFMRWRESTSTSPSGRHLGHYQALLAYSHLDETEEAIQPLSTKLFNTILDVNRLAVKHDIILERWLDVVNVMIEKIPGRPLITKLRVIHVVEANLSLGILWRRRFMAQTERLRALDDQQFGSRKGRSSEEVALLKHTN